LCGSFKKRFTLKVVTFHRGRKIVKIFEKNNKKDIFEPKILRLMPERANED